MIFSVFICMGLISNTLKAQTVLISKEINIRPDEAYQIIGGIGDHIYFFHQRGAKIEIQVYDVNLRYIRTHEMVLEKKKIHPFGVNVIDDKINFLYYFKDNGKIVMGNRQFNSILEITNHDTLFVSRKIDFTRRFFLIESEDGEKALIYSFDTYSQIDALCYDFAKQSTLWTRKVESEGKLKDKFHSAHVSNSGAGYIVSDHSPKSFKKQQLKLEVTRFSRGMDKPLSFMIEVSDLKTERLAITYDNKNNFLVAAGLYGEKGNNRQNGLYMLRVNTLNPEKKIYKKYPFDPQLENEIISESRDKHDGILDLVPVDIVIREDGGILLLSEIQKINQRYGNSGTDQARSPNGRNWTDHYHEDIVMHALFPDGQQHWNLVLHKKQYSQDDSGAYSSFFIFKNRSALRLFFNDEISTNNTVSEYIITGDGNSRRKSVMSTEYQKLRMRFTEAIQLNGTSFIVPSDNGNKINLVKIDYSS